MSKWACLTDAIDTHPGCDGAHNRGNAHCHIRLRMTTFWPNPCTLRGTTSRTLSRLDSCTIKAPERLTVWLWATQCHWQIISSCFCGDALFYRKWFLCNTIRHTKMSLATTHKASSHTMTSVATLPVQRKVAFTNDLCYSNEYRSGAKGHLA